MGEKDSPFTELGASLITKADRCLIVAEIARDKDSLLPGWNAGHAFHPALQVYPGDTICSVNGITDDAERMKRELYQATKLNMTIRHSPAILEKVAKPQRIEI